MSPNDDFWSAHDQHRERINTYLTLALAERFDELRTTVYADFDALVHETRFDLVMGLVGALALITEQAADAGGTDIEGYLQKHLLDVDEMMSRRDQE
jgi:hypothetical protein